MFNDRTSPVIFQFLLTYGEKPNRKKLKPGLEVLYTIQSRNGLGLFYSSKD